MTTLIERLRGSPRDTSIGKLDHEAADALEAMEAENEQLRCDTKEVAAARSFLRDQNRLLAQLAARELALKQMREAVSFAVSKIEGGWSLDALSALEEFTDTPVTTGHLDAYVKGLLGEPVAWQSHSGTLAYDPRHFSPTQRALKLTPLYALKDKP